MLAYVGENASRYTLNYGNVSKSTIGAIQRAVAVLEDQGGDQFFGEPALNIADWMQLDEDGRGFINILSCDKLFLNPLMYSTFLLWMLSELYETLPEQGDSDKPRMALFSTTKSPVKTIFPYSVEIAKPEESAILWAV